MRKSTKINLGFPLEWCIAILFKLTFFFISLHWNQNDWHTFQGHWKSTDNARLSAIEDSITDIKEALKDGRMVMIVYEWK